MSNDQLSLSRAYRPDAVNITIEEAALLQSFPPDFEFVGKKGEKGLIIGNAIPVLMAQAALEELWS